MSILLSHCAKDVKFEAALSARSASNVIIIYSLLDGLLQSNNTNITE